jgi:SAP domain-containing new25
MAVRLSAAMTLREFENGYWYLNDLKDFASQIGIPAATRLRMDELERAIVAFLRTGTVGLPTKRALLKTGTKDLARGLSLKLRIEHYISNRETKGFIVREARKVAPEIREKSGVWYRQNRWREDQVTNGSRPTYGDLVKQYVALNRMDRFDKIPYDCYINFVAEFLRAEKSGTHSDAIAAWVELKSMDMPKNYASWAKARRKHGKENR